MGDGDYLDFSGGVFYGSVTGVGAAAPASSGGVSNLLSAPAVFTGRDEETEQLLDVLDPSRMSGRPTVSAVSGLGGVGKTALTLHVAHTARERGWFPGGALFVDLRGYDEVPATSDHAVLSLLRAIVGAGQIDPSEDPYARYRAELSCREPVLIVLDNVSDPAQITPLLPGEGSGHGVLITSREVQDSLLVRQFTIGVLATEDACRLVRRSLREHDPQDTRAVDEPDAVRELVALCGHLPLALLIAAALLRRRKPRSVTTLTVELRAAADRVRALQFKGVDQYRRDLALRPVFDVMYARLEQELARVFRLLGQGPEDGIGIAAAASLTGLPLERLEPLLEELTAASLLAPLPGGGRWRMHDLVQLYVRTVVLGDSELVTEAAEARGRLLGYYYPAALEAKFQVQEPDRESEWFEGGRDHALGWLDSERTGLLTAARWTDTEDPTQAKTAMWLALSMDTYLELRHAFDDCAMLAVAARDTAHRFDIPEAEAMASDILGGALSGLRRFDEALDAHHHARDVYTGLGDLGGQARTWHNVAIALRGLRRHDEALDAKQHSLRSYMELGDVRDTAIARTSLGIVLDELGRPEEARAALAQALPEHSAAGNRDGEATALNSLGLVLLRLGRHDESVTTLTRALGLSAELGNWHLRAKAWNHLGLTLQGLGRFEEAADAHRRARDWNGRLGDSHTEATAWLNLGNALVGLSQPEEAVDAFRHACDLFKASGDWFYVGGTLNNMAGVFEMQKQTSEARTAFTSSAEAYGRAGAEAHAATARRHAERV
jgi:tetratricopeptide (TPR) repeat protein